MLNTQTMDDFCSLSIMEFACSVPANTCTCNGLHVFAHSWSVTHIRTHASLLIILLLNCLYLSKDIQNEDGIVGDQETNSIDVKLVVGEDSSKQPDTKEELEKEVGDGY